MNWTRAAVAAGVALPVVGLLAFGMTRDPKDIPSPLPGKPAPAVELATFAPGDEPTLVRAAGSPVKLSAMRDTVVVVNFFASWCMPCRVEHPALSAIARQYADKPVRFFGVLYNDTEVNGRRWIEMMGGQPYPALADPGARTAIDFGVYGVPETFFVGRDGRVASKFTGPLTEAVLVKKLDSLLAPAAPKGAD
ncbi:MAG: redoxin family protein [Gemmatimonadaceae bacterium]|jgi:cytochrome c biogenesis protein CcmG/thiol:disulfide interchange protein DsbE|nr:redoxin family protein [Gemmatimonadaceae bacterium]